MKTTGRIETTRAARYGHQLVSHMTRKVEGKWEEPKGHLSIGALGEVDLLATDEALIAEAEGPAETIAKLEDVVGRHVVRFGAKDALVCTWTREDNSAGTTQGPVTPKGE